MGVARSTDASSGRDKRLATKAGWSEHMSFSNPAKDTQPSLAPVYAYCNRTRLICLLAEAGEVTHVYGRLVDKRNICHSF